MTRADLARLEHAALDGRRARSLARRILRQWENDSPTGSQHTRTARRRDIEAFGRYLGEDGDDEDLRVAAAHRLLFGGFAEAQELVRGWLSWMAQRVKGPRSRRARFAPATRARRLAHLRGLVRVAQEYGLPWSLRLRGPRIRPARDTRGPEAWRVYAVVADLVRIAVEGPTDYLRCEAARDSAVLQLLFCLGLRRQTVADLELEDLDGETLWVRVKGDEQPRRRSLPPATRYALETWLRHRTRAPGPLFTGLRSDARARGMSASQIYRMACRRISNPHGLRHAGASKLAAEGHSVYELQAHLDHANAMSAQRYVDAHDDTPGATAAYLAEELGALYDALHERREQGKGGGSVPDGA